MVTIRHQVLQGKPFPLPPSPPRCPPPNHEVEDNVEISSEALMTFEQDEEAQWLMHALLEHNGDRYFQYMTSRGFRLVIIFIKLFKKGYQLSLRSLGMNCNKQISVSPYSQ